MFNLVEKRVTTLQFPQYTAADTYVSESNASEDVLVIPRNALRSSSHVPPGVSTTGRSGTTTEL